MVVEVTGLQGCRAKSSRMAFFYLVIKRSSVFRRAFVLLGRAGHERIGCVAGSHDMALEALRVPLVCR